MDTVIIEVFKTNVPDEAQAEAIITELHYHFPGTKINFDLHDCDKILRLEGVNFITEKVITLVEARGFSCNILE